MGTVSSFGNRAKLLIFSCAWLAVMPTHAAESLSPLNFKGLYEFRLGGLLVGRLGIEAEESKSGYAITADVKSAGVASIFSKHSSHTEVDGTSGAHPDITYKTDYRTKKKKRSVKLVYKGGEITKEEVVPPDNRATRPAVAAYLKNSAYDPLTLNLKLRRAVWEASRSDKRDFAMTTYDGRRLTKIKGTVEKRTIRDANNRKQPVIVATVRRELLAGFTKSEIEDYDPEEPSLFIYYSNDERFVPVKAEIPFLFGTLTGKLAKQCATGESCLLGNKD
jgi:hypothetical protein